MKAKLIMFAAALALSAGFTGCQAPPTNLTLPQTAANPSGIYTLSVDAKVSDASMIAGSEHVYIVIEGDQHEMTLAPYGDTVYTFDYAMPPDRAMAKYYFVINYDGAVSGGLSHARTTTISDGGQPYELNVVNQYVLTLGAARGPVGATIAVLGSGFNKLDYVVVGGLKAPTTFASENALTFVVPPLPGHQDYAAELHSGATVLPMGMFHVDSSDLKVLPASLELSSGDSVQLVVNMGAKAPEDGVPIQVLTDIPKSVIMPEVVIPAGFPTVSVKVTAGEAGEGSLHVTAPGFNTVVVPIKVSAAAPVIAPVAAPVAPTPAPQPAAMPAPMPVPAPETTAPAPTPEPATPPAGLIPTPAPAAVHGS